MKTKIVPNTVNGVPEREFRAAWTSWLWRAMAKVARGYRMWTLKNQPPRGAARWRGERRRDKVGTTKVSRRIALPMQIA